MIAALPLSVSAAGEYVPGNPRWSGYQNQVQWGRPAGAASGDSFEYEAQLLLGDDVVESKAVEIDTYLFFTNDVVTRPQEEYTIRVRARWIMIVGDPDGQYMVADVGEAEPPHEHSYTQKHDAAQHWQECSCGERLNVANHIYGDWRETKPATETEAGSRERDCTVCDYVQTETIPMLEHEHSYLDEDNVDRLRMVLWDMSELDWRTERQTREVEQTNDEGEAENTTITETVLIIELTHHTPEEMRETYHFTDRQNEYLTLLSGEDTATLWGELLGGFVQGSGELMTPGMDTVFADGALQWPLPVAGTITSPQGYRTDPITGEISYHKLMNYIRFWQAAGESEKTSMRTRDRIRQIVSSGILPEVLSLTDTAPLIKGE